MEPSGESVPEVASGTVRIEDAAPSREISNALLANLVAVLRRQGGDDLVERVRLRAGETRSVGVLTDLFGWSSLAATVALFEAAVAESGDGEIAFRAGQETFRVLTGTEFLTNLQALGGPEALFEATASASAKVSTVTESRCVGVGDHEAFQEAVTRAPYVRHRLLCDYSAGTVSMYPTVFGYEVADVTEIACQTRGDPVCLYHVRWDPRARADGPSEVRLAYLQERADALAVRFEALERVARRLAAVDGVEATLETVVVQAMTAASAPQHLLAVHLPGERRLRVRAVGMSEEEAETLAAEVMWAPAADVDDHGPKWSSPRIVVDVASPVRHHGRLAACFPPGHQFFPNEDRLLDAYARHAAATLDALVLLEEMRQLRLLAATLAEMGSIESMAQEIARAVVATSDVCRAGVLLPRSARDQFDLVAQSRWDDGAEAPVDEAPTGTPCSMSLPPALLTRWSAGEGPGSPTASDLDDVPEAFPAVAGFPEGIVAPIVAGGHLLGLLVAQPEPDRGRGGGGRGETVARLRAAAQVAAPALRSAQLLDVLHHEATHDSVTGLPNGRLLTDRLSVALDQARRSGAGVGLLFLDLDGFKAVNDSLGHASGDDVLREVGRRVRSAVRESDSVARMGGDEFVVLLPAIGGRADLVVARERIETAVAREPVEVHGAVVWLRASVGMSCYPDDGESAADLMDRADAAMYRAKPVARTDRSEHLARPG